LSSRSSSRRAPLGFGRVAGVRGGGGEITVRVASGEARRWVQLTHVILAPADGPGEGRTYRVDGARAYRDRLVLRLQGVAGGHAAEVLRGLGVLAPAEEVPELPEGEWYAARLVGLAVRTEQGESIGRVADVMPTGGADLLVVDAGGGEEILVPLAHEIVTGVDTEEGVVVVRLPEGLRELNRAAEDRG
jgi:16S rRNA processing protein RimM